MTCNVRITETGSYVPALKVSNDDLSKIMDTNDEWISSRTGIASRRIVTKETTADLCGQVAKQIIQRANLDPAELDFIIVATMTSDYTSPSTACLVQSQIGAKNAFAFDVTAACSGFIYALSIGENFLRGGRYQKGLIIGGETLSRMIDWEDRSTAVLFGDGAGGVLLEWTEGNKQFLQTSLHSDGSRALNLTAGALSSQTPFMEEPQKSVSAKLAMNGRAIFDFALREVSTDIQNTIEASGLASANIDYILPHQANTRIIDGIAKKTKIKREKFLTNIQNYGNTSAATIPILLDENIQSQHLTLGSEQKIVLTGFGGGLTWGSILLSL